MILRRLTRTAAAVAVVVLTWIALTAIHFQTPGYLLHGLAAAGVLTVLAIALLHRRSI